VSTSAIGTAASSEKRRIGRGEAIKGWQGRSREFLVHVLCKVENVGHDFFLGEAIVGVERVDDTLFGLTEVAGT
jgi:hypothetical protein